MAKKRDKLAEIERRAMRLLTDLPNYPPSPTKHQLVELVLFILDMTDAGGDGSA